MYKFLALLVSNYIQEDSASSDWSRLSRVVSLLSNYVRRFSLISEDQLYPKHIRLIKKDTRLIISTWGSSTRYPAPQFGRTLALATLMHGWPRYSFQIQWYFWWRTAYEHIMVPYNNILPDSYRMLGKRGLARYLLVNWKRAFSPSPWSNTEPWNQSLNPWNVYPWVRTALESRHIFWQACTSSSKVLLTFQVRWRQTKHIWWNMRLVKMSRTWGLQN